mmetsp:Transcript_50939/g.154953  ORF Transcript_50939/g.154953 Transcript_50939/m.154953 type:complete len:248 (-) Transcript_50939:86-829(-)
MAEIPADLVVAQRQDQPECPHGHRDPSVRVVATPFALQVLVQLQVPWPLGIDRGGHGRRRRRGLAGGGGLGVVEHSRILGRHFVSPELVPHAGQEREPQNGHHVRSLVLFGLGERAVELFVVRQRQPDVLRLEADVEGSRGDRGAGREPHRRDEEDKGRAKRDELMKQDPLGHALGQARGPEQGRGHAELQASDHVEVGHLLGRQGDEVPDVLPVQLELLHLVGNARVRPRDLLAAVVQEVGAVVVP